MKNSENKYNVYKCDSKCNFIEGTEKIYIGPSERWVMAQVAYENKVKINPGATLVRLPSGEFYVCDFICAIK